MRRHRYSRNESDVTRRAMMWKSACATMGATAFASTVWDLRYMKAAVAASVPASAQDYKALVCLFLFGGNDANNLIIATDGPSYSAYVAARGGAWDTGTNSSSIALSPATTTFTDPQSGTVNNIGVLPVTNLNNDGHNYALHPACTEMQAMFNNGNLAFLVNVGTLAFPYVKGSKTPKPFQLFSHNDQQIQWQTSVPDAPSRTGWGGRSADQVDILNTHDASHNVSMSISLAGTNTFEIGNQVNAFKVNTGGPQSLSGATAETTVLKQLIDGNPSVPDATVINALHPNLQQQDFATTINNGIRSGQSVSVALAAIPAGTVTGINNSFATNSGLAQQFKMIAKLIAARGTLGHNRQIFFASVGGFDLHGAQGAAYVLDPSNPVPPKAKFIKGTHYNLLRDVSQSLDGFRLALLTLGNDATGVPVFNRVTTFTVSDFSRTFKMNPTFGSDHGWGNHQFIMGGAVQDALKAANPSYVAGQGSKVFGNFPNYVLASSNDYDTGSGATGRWIPDTSCDEYFSTLAQWFGVSQGNLSTVLPNIGRFAHPNLGFIV